jgi:hypothetical protein
VAGTIFLESLARPLLVIHALVAFAALGATTHLTVISVGLWRGKVHLSRLAKVHAQVIGATFAACFVLGLLVYPAYRYYVRGLYFDRYAHWASSLFDLKENLAALGLPLSVALFSLGRRLDLKERTAALPLVVFLSVALWLITVFAVVSGLVVTSAKGL